MDKLYNRTYWEDDNAPDIDADNLNNIESGIDAIDNRVIALNDGLSNLGRYTKLPLKQGYYDNGTGAFGGSNPNWVCTEDAQNIEPNKNIGFDVNGKHNGIIIIYYDNSKNYIGYESAESKNYYSFNTPSNCAYFNIDISGENIIPDNITVKIFYGEMSEITKVNSNLNDYGFTNKLDYGTLIQGNETGEWGYETIRVCNGRKENLVVPVVAGDTITIKNNANGTIQYWGLVIDASGNTAQVFANGVTDATYKATLSASGKLCIVFGKIDTNQPISVAEVQSANYRVYTNDALTPINESLFGHTVSFSKDANVDAVSVFASYGHYGFDISIRYYHQGDVGMALSTYKVGTFGEDVPQFSVIALDENRDDKKIGRFYTSGRDLYYEGNTVADYSAWVKGFYDNSIGEVNMSKDIANVKNDLSAKAKYEIANGFIFFRDSLNESNYIAINPEANIMQVSVGGIINNYGLQTL